MQRIEAEKLKTVLILDNTDIDNLLAVYSHAVYCAMKENSSDPQNWVAVTISRQMLVFVGLTEKSISEAYNQAENRYNDYIYRSQLVDIYNNDFTEVIKTITVAEAVANFEVGNYGKTGYNNNRFSNTYYQIK